MKKIFNRSNILQVFSNTVVSTLIAMVTLLGTPITTFAEAPVRTFTAVITPSTVIKNTTETYSVLVTNTGNGEEIKSFRVIFPSGFSNVSNTSINLANWTSSITTTTNTNDTIWYFTVGNAAGIPSNGTGTMSFTVTSPSTTGSKTIDYRAFKNNSGNPGEGAEFNLENGSVIIVVGDPASCADEIDNDNDGKTDFPQDPGCADADDNDETDPIIVNQAPVAVADSYSTDEDDNMTTVAPGILLNDTDPENNSLTVVLVTGTTNGTLTLNSDGSLSYVPDPDYNGSDSFTYVANDGALSSAPATVTITVNAVNDAPTVELNGNSSVSVGEGDSYNDLGATCSDVDGESLTASVDGSVDTNTPGSYTLNYTCTDNGGLTSSTVTRTVTVTADPVNNQPVITLNGNSTITLNVGDTYTEEGAVANDVEEGGPTTVTDIVSLVDTGTPGTYTVTYNYTDGGGLAANTVTRTVIVEGPNNAPIIDEIADFFVNVGDSVNFITIATDPDNDPLTFYAFNDVDAGGESFNFSTGAFDWNSIAEEFNNKVYNFTVSVTDGDLTDYEQFAITVGNPQTETPSACSNGTDDDQDDKVDMQDPGCEDENDNDETDPIVETPTQCSNGTNDDGEEDALVDMEDPGCSSPEDNDETDPVVETPKMACENGSDDDQDGLTDMNDPGCSSPEDNDETDPVVTTTSGGGGGGGVTGYLKPQVLGASTHAPTEGRVLGESTCTPYLNSYIKLGAKNNKDEVKKLQTFLNENMGLKLKVDGNYGLNTYNAVKKFQTKYNTEVLTPWIPYGLRTPSNGTGYVYKTTQRWINMLKCPELNLETPKLP